MNSSTAQDVSLYDCALSAIEPPHPLQVSDRTLKGMVGALIDLLVEQKIPATLWVKLPHWWESESDIERYRKWVGGSNPIYLCKSYTDDPNVREREVELSSALNQVTRHPSSFLDRVSQSAPQGWRQISRTRDLKQRMENQSSQQRQSVCQMDENSLISDEGTIFVPARTPSPLCELVLPPDSKLNREYYLVVISASFCALILAHQPRSVQYEQGEEDEAPEFDPNRPLLALYSLDGQTIELVLNGLKQAVSQGRCLSFASEGEDETATETGAAVCENLLENWDSHFAKLRMSGPDALLVGHLLSKHLQRHEQQGHTHNSAKELEALQRQNEELLKALRFKDEFLNKIGQELRTPLTNMKTALTLLNSPKLKPAQRDRYSSLLHQSCDRQTSLINGFLELVRLDSEVEKAKMQPMRLMDIIPGIVSTYQPLAQEKGILLAYTLRNNLPFVFSVSEWLKKVTIAMLDNSIKFTPKGGEVWVRAKQQGEFVQIEFRDTGIGIPAHEIPKIFDSFYRGRQAINDDLQGAGLGLTIAQKLLLHCGGSISVKSRVGKGSVFTILLPVYSEENSLGDWYR